MKLEINKGIAIAFSCILIIIYICGLPIKIWINNFMNPSNVCDSSFIYLFISNIDIILSNLANIIIGIWMFINSESLKQNKWTWLLLGLVYGEYSLILILILLILENIKIQFDIFKSIQNVILLLILIYVLKLISQPLITGLITRMISPSDYLLIFKELNFVPSINFGFVFLLNIIIAIKFYKYIESVYFSSINRLIWIIATLFLGLFPVILFNNLIIMKKENK